MLEGAAGNEEIEDMILVLRALEEQSLLLRTMIAMRYAQLNPQSTQADLAAFLETTLPRIDMTSH